jgi:hypothetical protein
MATLGLTPRLGIGMFAPQLRAAGTRYTRDTSLSLSCYSGYAPLIIP